MFDSSKIICNNMSGCLAMKKKGYLNLSWRGFYRDKKGCTFFIDVKVTKILMSNGLFSNNSYKEDVGPNNDPSINFGKFLANPVPGDEVVISGLSGTYPESQNVHQFRDNLLNKIDMITDDNRRWNPANPEIPERSGKVPDLENFDAGFFGVHCRQATNMDPMLRLLYEKVIEAVFDAGFHLSDLEGTNTGVFVGACKSDTEPTCFMDNLKPQGYAITGCTRSMLARRISYFLKLKGSSFICDTACSSSLYAVEHAYSAIRTGKCDMAIVCGSNICLNPGTTLQFARLGVLSIDGTCKVFDEAGNGYVRSEAMSVIILQRSKTAKRIYSTIVHTKSNCDGYKDLGITFPSKDMQVQLLDELFEECNFVKPCDLSFIEAHGTGTKVGDPVELNALEQVFLKERSTPLLIGSVKSNIGHCEPSSGLCSITKAIITFETGYIPPNLYYNSPRSGVESLKDGRLKVVTEKMPYNDSKGIIGINNFGFGGANCHVVLKRNPKQKVHHGGPQDNIPRLVCVSGRCQEAVDVLLDDVIENQVDVEHIRLLHDVFRKNITGHYYRGYSLLAKSGEIARSCTHIVENRQLVLCFGEIDETIRKNARQYFELPIAIKIIQRIQEVIRSKVPNISEILLKIENATVFETVLANFTIQMIFADIFKALDLIPKKVFGLTKGLSLGTLVCAYFDGSLELKEVVECAYSTAVAMNSFDFNVVSSCNGLSDLVKTNSKIATQLEQALKQIIAKPRKSGRNDIFEVSPSEILSTYLSKYLSSTNVLRYVKSAIPKDFVIFEVGNGYINKLLKKELDYMKEKFFLSITHGGLNDFFMSLGRLYEIGHNPQLQKLFPKVEYPVSRGTPMISPKIKWNHTRKWWVPHFQHQNELFSRERSFVIMVKIPEFSFVGGHIIDGKLLFPATGYLNLVWSTLALIYGLDISEIGVVFENCKFRRACSVPKEGNSLQLTVLIQKGSGNFEIIEGDVAVVTGRVTSIMDNKINLAAIPLPSQVSQAPSMTSKDIYKELRLRGYDYKDQFRGIRSCDINAEVGEIVWDGNWVTFMDNMLQMKILQEDTRLLYVPTTIQRLTINTKEHLKYVQAFGKDTPTLPMYVSRDTGIIRSGFIEIRGLQASAISRRKYLRTPVLEKYVFVPNIAKLQIEEAIRVNMQILLENFQSMIIKALELRDEASDELQLLGDHIHSALADQPLIQSEIILCEGEQNKKSITEVDFSLIVGSRILQRKDVMKFVFRLLKENGFILSREPLDFDLTSCSNQAITIVTAFSTEQERLILFKQNCDIKNPITVKLSSEDQEFTWIQEIKYAMETKQPVLLHSQGEPLNGALGLIACLKREPGGHHAKLLFTPDSSAPEFDLTLPFYQEQVGKNLAINVYKNGQWGTYRHLLLGRSNQVKVEHCYLNTLDRGNLSSLRWIEGPLTHNSLLEQDSILVSVYYAALNFRDIMMATGKINADTITKDRREQECLQGFEFSGRTQNGKRVMGMLSTGACASLVKADKNLLLEIPDDWSLADAATVPVVYGTCVYAFFMRGELRRGSTVLIHSGAGGIGQAAITLALHAGCTVYTTVGTPEKRTFLKKKFPVLTDKNIAYSRDTSFETHIMKFTRGKGVDVVLNSLAEEKLIASVRCLAKGGRFLEIGKFDIANDNNLSLLLMKKEASFHGVMLDAIFHQDLKVKLSLMNLLQEYINNGAIQPLGKTIFNINQAEEAFRYMSSGKHMGKVLLQVIKEDKEKLAKPQRLWFPAVSRYYCDNNKTYIVCGGLGGFGLELADWLVLRGCRKLVLTSRNGIKTGYQAYRISIWRSYGCVVQISTDDISIKQGCQDLINKANQLGPVHAIFNLAVVLKDALLVNQTEDSFKISFQPKAFASQFLDDVSRQCCPELRDFVMFSSVSCGRGNAGQTNYGMSNSVMERICEKRKSDGFPALAIEWGAVGDVGLVAELQDQAVEIAIGGTLQQRITNCLQCMDILLRQEESAVVSSIVVAEKQTRAGQADSIVDVVTSILGVNDLKSISLHATLAELGMDSMNAVEIKQTLERDFEVFLTAQDIRNMTFARLIDIETKKDEASKLSDNSPISMPTMGLVYQFIGDASTINIPILPIKGKLSGTSSLPTLVLFPGIEGTLAPLESFYKNLEANIVGLQYPNDTQKETIEDMARTYLLLIEKHLSRSEPFNFVCHSFGGIIALEAAHQLEEKGYKGTIICIDSSPDYLKGLIQMFDLSSEDKFQVSLLVAVLAFQTTNAVISKYLDALIKCHDFDARINIFQSIIGPNSFHTPEHLKACANSFYKRIKALIKWIPGFKLKSKVLLFKPTVPSVNLPDEDYGLSKLCEDPVDVKVFNGNHTTILENSELSTAVQKSLV